MTKRFISQLNTVTAIMQPSFWFIFKQDDILLAKSPLFNQIPRLKEIEKFKFDIMQQCYLGTYGNIPCFTAQVQLTSHSSIPADFAFLPIRQAHAMLADEHLFHIVTRARQILHWDKSTRFCGHCGEQTIFCHKERAKQCPICNVHFFPQVSPVMLVLIWRKNEILLARSASFPPGIYSILAGFVEPGETLEEAVSRETKEEVSLEIKNLTYFGSQPWPFPSNLMLGFTAEYQGGEIIIDPNELEDAQWFPINQLPPLPKPISISRMIIDTYINSLHKKNN